MSSNEFKDTPDIEVLFYLMSVPLSRYKDILREGDGRYTATLSFTGESALLGTPHPVHDGPAQSLTNRVWKSLTPARRKRVQALATLKQVRLEEFGIV